MLSYCEKRKESEEQKLKKNEKIFLILLIFTALCIWFCSKFFFQDNAEQIFITVNGEDFGCYSLDKDQIIAIGDTNVCEITNGEARMIEATCPDHLCIKQHSITKQGGTIVCLPNKIVIKGGASGSFDDDFSELDAIS